MIFSMMTSWWNKYTIYVHCWKIYNLFVQALETGRKVSLWQGFLDCFTEQQCTYNTSKLSEIDWNERHFHCFQWCYLLRQLLYCYRFFLSLYKNKVPEILHYVHDLITLNLIWSPLLVLKITQLQDNFFYFTRISQYFTGIFVIKPLFQFFYLQ